MIQSANNHLPIFNNVLFWFHVLASIYPYPVWGSPYQSADHYWPMYNITDGILEDVEGAAHTVVYNGGKTVQVAQLGSALVLDGQDDWVDTGGFNADCVTNPSTCTEGFTMTFWLKVYSSGYVMSSGSFTNHRNGPGYRLFYKQRLQRFEFLLETKQKRWTLLLHEEVGLWTHMAFTWRDQSGLSYYEDGNLSTYTNKPIFLSPLRQQNYTPVITLARPNNLMRVREFGKFEISQFAIWLKELSAEDIAGVYARGVTYDQKFTFCCHFKSVSPCVTDPCYDADKCRKISQSNEKKCICPAVNLQLKTCTAKITGDCEDKSSNCGRYAKQSRYCQHRKMRETCPRSCSYCAPPDFGSTIAAPTLITGSSSVSRVARDSNNHFTVEPTNARPMGQTSTKPTLPPGEGCGSECGSNVSLATTMRPGYVSTRRRMPRGESCDTLECSYYAHCEMTSYGYAECRCPETCAVEYAPVCGSDEKTYLNMCVLKLESCHTGEWVEKTKQGTCTPYGLAAHYWPLNGTTKDKQVLDIRGNSSAYAYGEGQSQTEQLGTVISLDGTDGFIGANDIKEKCIVDPTYCREGLSVAFWLKYTKGEFIISGGRYISSDHGPGFRFVHQGKGPQAGSSGKFLLEISTKTQRWKLLLESIPKWWFHFAFTWSKMQGLRLYENGKRVMSRTKPDPVKRPFAGKIPNDLTIGRPNSVFKMNSYGQFSIGHLVIWTNSLSSFDVRVAFVILLSKTISSMVCCNGMKGDPCITNPCQNGATCQRMDDKYQCVCPDVIGDCSRKRNVPEPCEDSESVECEKLASQEGYCQYHWRRMRNICPKACKFCGLTTQARKTLNSSSSTAQFLPQVSPSYTSSAIESFAKSTTTRHDFSTKADTRSTLARTTHIAQASSVISSVTASEKTSSPCKVNNVNCTCFSCDETRRRGGMLACCVDLIEPKTIQNGASIQLVGLTAQEVSERLSVTSRIIAEVVRESCTMRDCVMKQGSAARRKRRSQQDQSKWSNSSSSSENLRASSEDESRYQDNSDSSITQTSQKSLKRSTSVNKEALRPEVNPSNINISRVNTIIYRIASDPPTVQTAFYVTMTTINNGTNQTQVLDGNVLLQILRDKRQTLENRLNVTIDSISAWQAASTKETTTSGLLLPNPTPGSHGHETSLASSAAPTTVVVGRVEGQGAKGLSETVFIVIMCSAIGGLVLLIIVLVYLFTRFYRGRKGEFVPDKSYPHNQTKQEDDPGENGEAIPSFVDPSTPRITDVPHKPTRAESNARNAAGKKKKPMGVKITYKPPKWD